MKKHWGIRVFFPIIIWRKGERSVGWSVANALLQSGFRSTIDSPRHFQTSEGTNRNNFYVNPDHPRRPQTPLTKLQKIQILTGFGLGQRTLTVPDLGLDSPRHFQTSKGTNRNNFYVNPDHPRRPQTPLTEFQKIQILAEFQICQRTLTKTVLNGQLQPGILAFILASCTWIDCSLAKYGLIILKDGRALREHLI